MFQKKKTLDSILEMFQQTKKDLAELLVSLNREKIDKQVDIAVLNAEILTIDETSIKAAKSLQKIEEILGD